MPLSATSCVRQCKASVLYQEALGVYPFTIYPGIAFLYALKQAVSAVALLPPAIGTNTLLLQIKEFE